jgi:hypothetical protein
MPTITFKVSPDEARRVRAAARSARLTVSEFVRRKVGNPQKPKRGPLFQKCPVTGAKIFAPHPGDIPLTTETVREMLADFP